MKHNIYGFAFCLILIPVGKKVAFFSHVNTKKYESIEFPRMMKTGNRFLKVTNIWLKLIQIYVPARIAGERLLLNKHN